jgi:hypothetical protein
MISPISSCANIDLKLLVDDLQPSSCQKYEKPLKKPPLSDLQARRRQRDMRKRQ